MLRLMRASDWDDIAAIFNQSIIKGDVSFRTEDLSYEEWNNRHIKKCRFVYECNNRVIGYTVLSPTSDRECYKGVVEVSIFVDKNHLRQGIGTALLKKLMREAEKQGYWTLYSAIFSVNTASINLHKKCGFRIVGTRENIAKDRFGNWQSTTIMEWRNGII